jgi:hypothetical protein
MRNAHKTLSAKLGQKRSLGKRRHRWKTRVKVNFKVKVRVKTGFSWLKIRRD